MHNPIVIVGCTASGKSDLAEALARQLGATVMAVDSMQVYRGMDIGTAKPPLETRRAIPHEMIDVAEPWERFSAARFAAQARPILDRHIAEGRQIILVGGTILYLRALLEGIFAGPTANAAIRQRLDAEAQQSGVPALHKQLAAADPLAASRIHPNDLRRIVRALEVFAMTGRPISDLQTQWNREHPAIAGTFIGVARDRDVLNRRINARVKAMFAAGLVDEVRGLAAHPKGLSMEAASAVGYRQLLDHFAGQCTLEEAMEMIKIQTRHLAKLQRTWLKRFTNTTWLEVKEEQAAAELASTATAHIERASAQ
jgi:tRNA dimethylallyltransferase